MVSFSQGHTLLGAIHEVGEGPVVVKLVVQNKEEMVEVEVQKEAPLVATVPAAMDQVQVEVQGPVAEQVAAVQVAEQVAAAAAPPVMGGGFTERGRQRSSARRWSEGRSQMG